MANPAVLSAPTVLYCAAEPDGREFPAGHEWPGDAWSTDRGGEPVGKKSTAQAAKDLIAAQDKLDAMSAQMDRQTHSMAERTAERDDAVNALGAMEQRAIAAETTLTEAEEAARGYMVERDDARSNLQTATSALASVRADLETAQAEAAKVPGLVAELETANQTVADQRGQIAQLTADLDAATAPKPTKGAKADAVAVPGAGQAADQT